MKRIWPICASLALPNRTIQRAALKIGAAFLLVLIPLEARESGVIEHERTGPVDTLTWSFSRIAMWAPAFIVGIIFYEVVMRYIFFQSEKSNL